MMIVTIVQKLWIFKFLGYSVCLLNQNVNILHGNDRWVDNISVNSNNNSVKCWIFALAYTNNSTRIRIHVSCGFNPCICAVRYTYVVITHSRIKGSDFTHIWNLSNCAPHSTLHVFQSIQFSTNTTHITY